MTATCETAADGLGQPEAETCRLCQLPDVPLMRIFSYLPIARDRRDWPDEGEELTCIRDHFAVACACPRVAALTRTLPSMWLGRKVDLDSLDEGVTKTLTLDLLRAGPSVDKLVLTDVWEYGDDGLGNCFEYPKTSARFRSYRIRSQTDSVKGGGEQTGSTSLMLSVNCLGNKNIASLIRGVGLELKHLVSYVVVPIASLGHAQNLETLYLDVGSSMRSIEAWPQSMSLPRLHTVRLDCRHDSSPDDATLEVLRSLLLAHSGQLRSVALLSQHLPLLNACPADLERLSIRAARGGAAGLERLRSLKELFVLGLGVLDNYDSEDFAPLLRSWSGPLERLVLVECVQDETVRALGTGRLTSLTRLELVCRFAELESLGLALSGLPRLRRLELRDKVPPPEVIRDVSSAPIAALELILIRGVDRDAPTYDEFPTLPNDVTGLVPALKELVLRAPKQLHVGLSPEAKRAELFFRHSAAESECALCAEAAAALGSHRGRSVPIEKCEVTMETLLN